MTNIPYAPAERNVWKEKNNLQLTNDRFKSALRIDAFVQSNWQTIVDILAHEGFRQTEEGLGDYIEYWIGVMSPEYLMASLPTDYEYRNLIKYLVKLYAYLKTVDPAHNSKFF